jgi:hypothetical protein
MHIAVEGLSNNPISIVTAPFSPAIAQDLGATLTGDFVGHAHELEMAEMIPQISKILRSGTEITHRSPLVEPTVTATEGYNSLLTCFNRVLSEVPANSLVRTKEGIILLSLIGQKDLQVKGKYYRNMEEFTHFLPSTFLQYFDQMNRKVAIQGMIRHIKGKDEMVGVFDFDQPPNSPDMWRLGVQGIEQLGGKGIESQYRQIRLGINVRIPD